MRILSGHIKTALSECPYKKSAVLCSTAQVNKTWSLPCKIEADCWNCPLTLVSNGPVIINQVVNSTEHNLICIMVVVVANLFLFGRSSILILIFQETPHRHLLFLQRFDFFFFTRASHIRGPKSWRSRPGSDGFILPPWIPLQCCCT